MILHFLEIRLRRYYQLRIARGLNPLKQNPGESVPNPGESVPNPGESVPNPGESVSGQKTEGGRNHKRTMFFSGGENVTSLSQWLTWKNFLGSPCLVGKNKPFKQLYLRVQDGVLVSVVTNINPGSTGLSIQGPHGENLRFLE